MPTIISGLDPSVRMNAYLAGQKFQTQIQEQQAEEQREAQRQRTEVFKAILEHHKERAKALADANKRAQMGDVIALQQQNLEAAAARKPMSQQRLEALAEVGAGVTDPDVRKVLQDEGEMMLGEMEKEEQKKASMDVINAGAGDGLIDPELAQQRLASGEEPETIAKEIKAARDKRDEEELNLQESTEAMEYAQHTLAGLPPGTGPARRVAKVIQKFRGAQTAQRQKGAGKAFRDQVLRAAAFQGEEETELRELTEAKHKKKERELSPKYVGEFFSTAPVKPGGPFVAPVGGSGLAGQAAQKSLKRTGKGGPSMAPPTPGEDPDQALIQRLIADGVPLTPENILAAGGLGGQ